jgi:hypothetical protein
LEEKKMEKILPVLVMGILVLSGLGAAAFSTNVSLPQTTQMLKESTSVFFTSQPTVSERDGFVEIQLDGATSQLFEPNKPVLPIYIKTYEIPFRSTDIQVVCQPDTISSMTLTKDVIPARIVTLTEINEQTDYVQDPAVYTSTAFYPNTWYSLEMGAGRNENNHQVTFVKVVCYPIRYSPGDKQLSFTSGFDIELTYQPPATPPQRLSETHDMVVISPSSFQAGLQSLIDEKNQKGISTVFKSMEDILAEYDGYDPPEQVKYFIKDAYDTWNITYVLLVGGLKSHWNAIDKDTRSAGYTDWYVPVRYTSMPHEDDEGCLCDLYYGCLYDANGTFDSWDSNGDGVYAAWNAPGAPKDTFDLYPEVYVSRLPVTTQPELKRVVKKILTYESTGPADKAWYKTFVGIAGKTFYIWNGKPDGEYLCDVAYNYTKLAIPDLKQVQLYSTNRDTGGLTPTPLDIILTITKGAGFVDFEGHGNPLAWNTIWFDGTYPNDWTGGLNVYYFQFLQNGKKLPVVVVGGCHNALYNFTIMGSLKDKDGTRYFTYGDPFPVCFCWDLVVKPRGGAIASTGCTGYGIGGSGDPTDDLSAELESNFFYMIGHNSTHFAETHGQAIRKYLSENTIGVTDAYCITIWATFGDPSLLFGGYSS